MTTKRKKRLNLFVFAEFSPDYSDGLAFAIAEDEADAKRLIEKRCDFKILNWGRLEIHSLSKKVARCVFGGG
jgi:hypothetical protein